MTTDNLCHRILLAKNQGCKVVYCEECDVTELEIGAISLRVESESLAHLYEVLKEATAKLAIYKNAKIHHEDRHRDNLHVDNLDTDSMNVTNFNQQRVGNVH